MAQKKRFGAALLAAVIILFVLVFSAVVIAHAHHDCSGVDCPICEQICTCVKKLKTLSVAALAVWTAAAMICLMGEDCYGSAPESCPSTLITLKVKLSN